MLKHLICGFAFILVSCESQNIRCNSAGKLKADEYTRLLFIFENPNRQYPEINTDLRDFCSITQKREKFVKEYAQKCFTGLSKQLTGVLMYGISKKNKYYCVSKRGNNELMTVGKCLNKIKFPAKQCTDTMIDDCVGILNAEIKMRIPMGCCAYYKLEECIHNHASNNGSDLCSENGQKSIEKLLNGYTLDVVKYICGDHTPDNDKCSKIIIPKKKPNQKKPYSMLTAFVDVLDSI